MTCANKVFLSSLIFLKLSQLEIKFKFLKYKRNFFIKKNSFTGIKHIFIFKVLFEFHIFTACVDCLFSTVNHWVRYRV